MSKGVLHRSASQQELEYDPAFQQAVRTSHGRRPPPTAARLAVGNQVAGGRKGLLVPPSSMGMRPITGAQDGGSVRPMTAVRAAGFQSGNKGDDKRVLLILRQQRLHKSWMVFTILNLLIQIVKAEILNFHIFLIHDIYLASRHIYLKKSMIFNRP